MSTDTNQARIKLVWNEDIRILKIQMHSNWKSVLQHMGEFCSETYGINIYNCNTAYFDEDNDKIIISDSSDWQYAVEFFKKTGNTMKLFITLHRSNQIESIHEVKSQPQSTHNVSTVPSTTEHFRHVSAHKHQSLPNSTPSSRTASVPPSLSHGSNPSYSGSILFRHPRDDFLASSTFNTMQYNQQRAIGVVNKENIPPTKAAPAHNEFTAAPQIHTSRHSKHASNFAHISTHNPPYSRSILSRDDYFPSPSGTAARPQCSAFYRHHAPNNNQYETPPHHTSATERGSNFVLESRETSTQIQETSGSTASHAQNTSTSLRSYGTSPHLSTAGTVVIKDIGFNYVKNNKIIPVSKDPAVTTADAEISLPSGNRNFVHQLVNNIDKDIQYSKMPDKYTIVMDEANNLKIFINKNVIKLQQWNEDLKVQVPMLTALEYLKWNNFSNSSNNIDKVVPQLFDVQSEQNDTNCWWLSSIKDQDSVYHENSMQYVLRSTSSSGKFFVYNCTGVNWCRKCVKQKIQRTNQKTSARQIIAPQCNLHKPPESKHMEKCAFMVIVYENELMAKDQEFYRFVIRLNHHTAYCSSKIMRAKPSASAWIIRNTHTQDPSGNESISSRYFNDVNNKQIQIGQIDRYYTDKDKIKTVILKAKTMKRQQQGVDQSVSKYTDWRVLSKGVPQFIADVVVHYEIDDSENKFIVLRVCLY